MLFVSSSEAKKGRVYLILKGGGYGCCEGSLTVITPDNHGSQKVVFHAGEQLISDISLLPGGMGIEMIAKSTLSEARSDTAESYDPFRIYIIEGDKPARYDLEDSKEYTIQHYCEWAGPNYNEKFVAVGDGSGGMGARHCHILSEAKFEALPVKQTK